MSPTVQSIYRYHTKDNLRSPRQPHSLTVLKDAKKAPAMPINSACVRLSLPLIKAAAEDVRGHRKLPLSARDAPRFNNNNNNKTNSNSNNNSNNKYKNNNNHLNSRIPSRHRNARRFLCSTDHARTYLKGRNSIVIDADSAQTPQTPQARPPSRRARQRPPPRRRARRRGRAAHRRPGTTRTLARILTRIMTRIRTRIRTQDDTGPDTARVARPARRPQKPKAAAY